MKRLKTGRTTNMAALMRLALLIGVLIWPAVFGGHAFAQSGNALTFDGADDYSDIGAGIDLSGKNFTVEAWIRLNAYDNSYASAILSDRDGGGSLFYIAGELAGTNKGKLAYDTVKTGGARFAYGNTQLSLNRWYHVAIIFEYNGGNKNSVSFYLDGEPDGGGNVSDVASGTKFSVGSDKGTGDFFDGQMDELRIWNTARTQKEIQENMNNVSLTGSEPGLVAHYKFDSGSGTTLADSAGSNDGTLYGSPTWTAISNPKAAGLWVGQIEITQVNEVGNKTDTKTPTDVANPLDMRILLHVDAGGQVRLVRNITVMNKRYTVEENGVSKEMVRRVLVTDKSLLPNYEGVVRRDGKLVGIRLGSPAFSLPVSSDKLAISGAMRAGFALAGNLALAADHPANPFQHKYHPDHKSGRNIGRAFTLTFDSDQGSDPGAGLTLFKGDYEESISGLHKIPIQMKGKFSLERVSTIEKLDDK